MNIIWYHWKRIRKEDNREIYAGLDGKGNRVLLEFVDGCFRSYILEDGKKSEIGREVALKETIMPEKHMEGYHSILENLPVKTFSVNGRKSGVSPHRVSSVKIRGTCVYADPGERKFYLKDGNSFKAAGDLYRKLIEEELEG